MGLHSLGSFRGHAKLVRVIICWRLPRLVNAAAIFSCLGDALLSRLLLLTDLRCGPRAALSSLANE